MSKRFSKWTLFVYLPAFVHHFTFKHPRLAIRKKCFVLAIADKSIKFNAVCVFTYRSKSIRWSACYRPPDCDSSFTITLSSVLVYIKNKFPKADLLPFGDFNFPLIDWVNVSSDGSRTPTKFLHMCQTFHLMQVLTSLHALLTFSISS